MTPFAASIKRYSDWLRSLLEEGAETPFPPASGKEVARARIEGGLMLTVPIEGGASRLKRTPVTDLPVSAHGRWQEVHLGALKAAYGRAPYFAYLFPEIEKAYREKSGETLKEFNDAIHTIVLRWLSLNPGGIRAIREAVKRDPDRIRTLGRERKKGIDPDYSILHLLFRLGKESLFVLLS
ncbi:MAG: WbqC family protein [Muribaculaceae bacterium]|nr:WbqC family protein [Muribaculaceae bacterium]